MENGRLAWRRFFRLVEPIWSLSETGKWGGWGNSYVARTGYIPDYGRYTVTHTKQLTGQLSWRRLAQSGLEIQPVLCQILVALNRCNRHSSYTLQCTR